LGYEVHSTPNVFITKERGSTWPKKRYRVSSRARET